MDIAFLASASLSDRGRVRRENQDAILAWQEQGLFVLADGMGGAEGGAYASHATVETIQRVWINRPPSPDLPARLTVLRQGAQAASRAVKTWADERQYQGCGTTLVTLLFAPSDRGNACILHAGDSRAYCLRDNSLQLLTHDHSMAAVIKNLHPAHDRTAFENVITRAVGLQETVELEETNIEYRPGDLFLLCSDGLSRMVPDVAIADVLRRDRAVTLEKMAQALVSAANAAGGRDNISVILVRVPAEATGGTERRTDTPDTQDGQKGDRTLNLPGTDDSEILSTATASAPVRAASARGAPAAGTGAESTVPVPGAPQWAWRVAFVVGVLLTVLIVYVAGRGRSAGAPATYSPLMPESHLEPMTMPAPAPPPMALTPGTQPTVVRNIDEARRLVEMAFSTGRWGELCDRCIFGDDVRREMEREGLITVINDWQREWAERHDGPGSIPKAYEGLLAEVRVITAELGAAVPATQIDAWPDDASERADLYCRELRRYQTHVLRSIEGFVGTTRADLNALGTDPSRLFGRLERLTGSRAFGAAAAAPVMQEVVSNLGRLERWVASVRMRSFRAGDASAVVQRVVPVIDRNMDSLWAGLWNDIKALPDRPGSNDGGAGHPSTNSTRIVAARAALMTGRLPEWDTAAWRRLGDRRMLRDFTAAVCTDNAP